MSLRVVAGSEGPRNHSVERFCVSCPLVHSEVTRTRQKKPVAPPRVDGMRTFFTEHPMLIQWPKFCGRAGQTNREGRERRVQRSAVEETVVEGWRYRAKDIEWILHWTRWPARTDVLCCIRHGTHHDRSRENRRDRCTGHNTALRPDGRTASRRRRRTPEARHLCRPPSSASSGGTRRNALSSGTEHARMRDVLIKKGFASEDDLAVA
jgi:hypothetical protein